MIIGIIILAYPFVASFIFEANSTRVVMNYNTQVNSLSTQKVSEKKDHLKKCNNLLSEVVINDPLSFSSKMKDKKEIKTDEESKYNTQKIYNNDVYKDGEMLAYLNIPAINSILPVFEGTDDATLFRGIGHLKGTSYPYGGKSTHCVLTGHSGIASANLFSDLEKVSIGDVFYVTILNETHEYKVVDINTVKPDEASDYIRIEQGKDLCTLVTCTPITINTHRLLVKGSRIKYDGKDKNSLKDKQKQIDTITIISIIIAILLIGSVTFFIYKRRKKKKSLIKNSKGGTYANK